MDVVANCRVAYHLAIGAQTPRTMLLIPGNRRISAGGKTHTASGRKPLAGRALLTYLFISHLLSAASNSTAALCIMHI